jgi:hypothetical protein
MSYSSLWGINKDYIGEELEEYKNSWLFAPIIWDILPEKYIPADIITPYGTKDRIVGLRGDIVWKKTNHALNRSEDTPDRICWELSNSQIFSTKDKKIISDSIRKFTEQNKKYDRSEESGIAPLEQDHIASRFHEIADDILALDETKYPYFVFKGTDCDDAVERWFEEEDPETEEYKKRSLKDLNEFAVEFVIIENGKIKNFVSNLDFKYE